MKENINIRSHLPRIYDAVHFFKKNLAVCNAVAFTACVKLHGIEKHAAGTVVAIQALGIIYKVGASLADFYILQEESE